MKNILIPLLAASACLILAFKPLDTGGKIIRTTEGAAIITANAKVNAEDAAKILETVRSYGNDYGALAYYENGRVKTYGLHSLAELKNVGVYYETSMTPSSEAVVTGALFGKKFLKTVGKKVFVSTKLTRTTWKTVNAETQSTKKDQSSVLNEKMVIVASPAAVEISQKLNPILAKYSD